MSVDFNFQFLPLEGRLPGRSFEQQTEDAINNIGTRAAVLESSIGQLETDVAGAYQVATDAQSVAESAYSIASNNMKKVEWLELALSDITAIPVIAVEALFD